MISIIICCYNEKPIIETTWNKLKKAVEHLDKYEIIFVNDGSTDKTLEKLRNLNWEEHHSELDHHPVNIITYEENKGYGHALQIGLKKAVGDIIITLDADLAMNELEVIKRSITNLEFYDVCIFSRHQGMKAEYPLSRKIASWGYRMVNNILLGIPFKDTQSGFLAFKKSALKGIDLKLDDFSILVEMVAKFYNAGLNIKIIEVPIKFIHDTTSGETSIMKSVWKMFRNTLRIRGMVKSNNTN